MRSTLSTLRSAYQALSLQGAHTLFSLYSVSRSLQQHGARQILKPSMAATNVKKHYPILVPWLFIAYGRKAMHVQDAILKLTKQPDKSISQVVQGTEAEAPESNKQHEGLLDCSSHLQNLWICPLADILFGQSPRLQKKVIWILTSISSQHKGITIMGSLRSPKKI